MSVLTENLKALSHRFADSFTRKDLISLSDLFHETISLFDPSLKWVRGKKSILEVLEKQFRETSVVHYKVVRLYQEESTSIIEFILKFDAEEFHGVDFLEWQNERITQIRCYYNPPDK